MPALIAPQVQFIKALVQRRFFFQIQGWQPKALGCRQSVIQTKLEWGPDLSIVFSYLSSALVEVGFKKIAHSLREGIVSINFVLPRSHG